MAELSCGIVGLPNVGKSTLFNALTASTAEAMNYPFCTISPNVGVVDMEDPRLNTLAHLSNSAKIVPANVHFVDIAGLVEGASKGEGLGNQFLSNIRETNAIVHVVRCFESDNIVHVSGSVDPIRDIEVINTELNLADLQMAINILSKLEKQVKTKKELLCTFELIQRVRNHLDQNQPVRTLILQEEEKKLLTPFSFLTSKKVLYVANVSDEYLPSLENELVEKVRKYAEQEGNCVIPICARLEEEIAQLPIEERKAFLESLGLPESGLQRLVRASFSMLGLITFITTGEMETRAWTITKQTSAEEAAGKIHSDIQKGFIRAEVVSYEDMIACQGRQEARKKGLVRAEGREYIVQDGDVILFMHH